MPSLNWEAIGVVSVVLIAFAGLMLGIIKWFLNNYSAQIKESLTQLAKDISDRKDEIHRVEKELLTLRAELPEKYQRREDAIRQEVVTNAKLDALGTKMDMLIRGTS